MIENRICVNCSIKENEIFLIENENLELDFVIKKLNFCDLYKLENEMNCLLEKSNLLENVNLSCVIKNLNFYELEK